MQDLLDALQLAPAGDPPVHHERFGDRVAHSEARVQGRPRILEHRLDPGAELAQLRAGERVDVAAVEEHAPGGRPLEAKQEARGRRLAAAGLADEAERLLASDREADAVDRLHVARRPGDEQAPGDRKMLREVLDLDQRLAGDRSTLQHATSCAGPTGMVGGYSRRQRSST